MAASAVFGFLFTAVTNVGGMHGECMQKKVYLCVCICNISVLSPADSP